jgi:hypothetical protein
MTEGKPDEPMYARYEYRLYKRYGRPSSPYHIKCLACNEIYEPVDDLSDADHAIRRHAGYHGGWENEDAEIVLLSDNGRELTRFHAIHTAEKQYEVDEGGCPNCQSRIPVDRISCPECSFIPEEARLKP